MTELEQLRWHRVMKIQFTRKPFVFCCLALLSMMPLSRGGIEDGKLDIYWVDVEGGAATLIVTPTNESILIDTGNPGERDSSRIHRVATAAGLERIDHLIVTHFHTDHFGGAADLAKRMPIDRIHDNGIPDRDPDGRPDNEVFAGKIQPYREIAVSARSILNPGDQVPLKPVVGGVPLSLRCLVARQEMIDGPPGSRENPDCESVSPKAKDLSDNANSIVVLLQFGEFDLFVGGDLTWNVESRLVCPVNRVGEVDVYQVDHHGLDQSNHPALVRALAPTLAVMSNGTSKGCQPATFATLQSVPSIQAVYQIHKNLRDDTEHNTSVERIANLEAACRANFIKLSVEPSGASYRIQIPATGQSEVFVSRSISRR